MGDDNEPTFTAPANKPDIECFYQSFNSICEVTMLAISFSMVQRRTTRYETYLETLKITILIKKLIVYSLLKIT